MTSSQLNLIAPLDTPLPSPQEGKFFTKSQWVTLMAIADTIVPSIEVSSEASLTTLSLPASEYSTAIAHIEGRLTANQTSNLPTQYLRENASSLPGFQDLLSRTLGEYLREDARKGLRVILSALE